uniref:VWFC domain-containing protein n=1 Tax=Callorhinchus milii TaxID=7868 RepID=A0A4W3IXZ8_CALMI
MESFVHTGTFLLLVIAQVPLTGAQVQSCTQNGVTHNDKDVWKSDSCVLCVCDNGLVVCDEIICRTVHCFNAEIPLGECCPICPDSLP